MTLQAFQLRVLRDVEFGEIVVATVEHPKMNRFLYVEGFQSMSYYGARHNLLPVDFLRDSHRFRSARVPGDSDAAERFVVRVLEIGRCGFRRQASGRQVVSRIFDTTNTLLRHRRSVFYGSYHAYLFSAQYDAPSISAPRTCRYGAGLTNQCQDMSIRVTDNK